MKLVLEEELAKSVLVLQLLNQMRKKKERRRKGCVKPCLNSNSQGKRGSKREAPSRENGATQINITLTVRHKSCTSSFIMLQIKLYFYSMCTYITFEIQVCMTSK